MIPSAVSLPVIRRGELTETVRIFFSVSSVYSRLIISLLIRARIIENFQMVLLSIGECIV